MSDGPFDHLELPEDSGSLPQELELAINRMTFERMEITRLEEPGRPYAMRLDGKGVLRCDDEAMPSERRLLFDYIAKQGVTPALLQYIRGWGRTADYVEHLSLRPETPEPCPQKADGSPEGTKPRADEIARGHDPAQDAVESGSPGALRERFNTGSSALGSLLFGLAASSAVIIMGVVEVVTGRVVYRSATPRTLGGLIFGEHEVLTGPGAWVDGAIWIVIGLLALFYQLFPWRGLRGGSDDDSFQE